ncbi:uncharacterized protein [Miscanthus floridulus]|uniref:uncharacterized protein n=1 Tax=Miscanthus floridulus TaxID=154761 RepID=UPI00345B135B
MTFKVAPTTRQALLRVTAREPPNRDPPCFGKFWVAGDEDSDSDCEDLGVVEPYSRPTHPILASASVVPEQAPATSSSTKAIPATSSTSQRRPRAPNPWKGPLPRPRITPATTLGDFLRPAMRRGQRRYDGGEISSDRRIQILNRDLDRVPIAEPVRLGPLPIAEPNQTGPVPSHLTGQGQLRLETENSSRLRGPTRRLVRPLLTAATARLSTATARLTYREVLMAGRGGDIGRRWSRGVPYRGAASDRRGRGRGDVAGRNADAGRGDQGRRDRGNRGGHAATGQPGGPPLRGGRGRGTETRGRGQNPRTATGATAGSKVTGGGTTSGTGGGSTSGTGGDVEPTQPPTEQINADDGVGNKRKRNLKRECTICLEEHFTNQCPLLRGPKPAVAFCGAAEDGCGFFQIQTAKNSQIVECTQSTATALVKVEVGVVSAQLLQSELARLVPVKWKWEVQQEGERSYVVPFPNTEELDRMINIRYINTKNKEGTLLFEKFVDDVQPTRMLDQVWVTVTKVPRALRAFIPLWAVGSIIGTTQKVDMIHLRATGQVRILVAVLDAKKIPELADVCVGAAIYRLFFKPDDTPQVVASDPDDDDLLSDQDKQPEGDKEMEDADDNVHPNPQQNSNAPENSQQPPQQPLHKHAALVNEVLDLACEELLQEISLKAMLDNDSDLTWKKYSPPKEVADFVSHKNIHDSSSLLTGVNGTTAVAVPNAIHGGGKELGGSTSPMPPSSVPSTPPYHSRSAGPVPTPVTAARVEDAEAMMEGADTTEEGGAAAGDGVSCTPHSQRLPPLSSTSTSSPPAPTNIEPVGVEGSGLSVLPSAVYVEALVESVATVKAGPAADTNTGGCVECTTPNTTTTSPPVPAATELPVGVGGVDTAPTTEVKGTRANTPLAAEPEGGSPTSPPVSPAEPVLTQVTEPPASSTTVACATITATPTAVRQPTAPTAPKKELRRSTRNAAGADINTLQKAEWLAAKKNLEFPDDFQRRILASLLGATAAG